MLDVSGLFMYLTDSVTQNNGRAIFVEFYGYSMNNESLFLAMEYFPLGDFKRHLEDSGVGEEEAKKIVYDLLVGLKIMHAEGIIHRDLKPEVRRYMSGLLPFRKLCRTRPVILSHH
jgi:hypothetical protein